MVTFLLGLFVAALWFMTKVVKEANEAEQHNVATHLREVLRKSSISLNSTARITLSHDEREQRRRYEKRVVEPVVHQFDVEPKHEGRQRDVVYSSRGILTDGGDRYEKFTAEVIAADESRLERFSKSILNGGDRLKKLTFEEANKKMNATSGSGGCTRRNHVCS